MICDAFFLAHCTTRQMLLYLKVKPCSILCAGIKYVMQFDRILNTDSFNTLLNDYCITPHNSDFMF